MPITPNMGLTQPTVGTTQSPTWAQELNNDLQTIDQHNHEAGSGVQIQPAGLNINANLTFQGNNATNLNAIQFEGAVSGTPAVLSVYTNGTDLFYKDVNGNSIQLTKSGGPNAGTGNIQGLPSTPIGGAGISWINGSSTFNMLQDSGTVGANVAMGSLVLTYPGSYPTPPSNGVSLEVPSTISSGYSLFLPTALPSQTNFVTLTTAGQLQAVANVDNSTLSFTSNTLSVANQGVTATQIANNTITTNQISNTAGITNTQQAANPISAAVGSATTTSTTPVTVATITLAAAAQPSVRPVLITLQPLPGTQGYFSTSASSPSVTSAEMVGFITITNTTTGALWEYPFGYYAFLVAGAITYIHLPATISIVDTTGTNANTSYTYTLKLRSIGVAEGITITASMQNVVFAATQL